jgi:hypothetical protein
MLYLTLTPYFRIPYLKSIQFNIGNHYFSWVDICNICGVNRLKDVGKIEFGLGILS